MKSCPGLSHELLSRWGLVKLLSLCLKEILQKKKKVKAQSIAIKALKLYNCAQYQPLSSQHLLLCGTGVGDRQHLLVLTVSGVCFVSLSES